MAQDPPKTENYVVIKLLIPVYCAGAIIGKDGLEIQRIKSTSGARVKVSRNRDLFPRTDERVVLVSGTPDQVVEVIKFIQQKIKNETPPDNRRINPKRKDQMKLIVAHTAAGRIIGRKGDKVNKLKQDFDVKVYITNKDENIPTLNERVVTIEGLDDNVRATTVDIMAAIQENPEARLSRSLEYRRFSENPFGGYFYGPPPPHFRGGHYGGSQGGYGGYSGGGGGQQGAQQGGYGGAPQGGSYGGGSQGGSYGGYSPGYNNQSQGYGGGSQMHGGYNGSGGGGGYSQGSYGQGNGYGQDSYHRGGYYNNRYRGGGRGRGGFRGSPRGDFESPRGGRGDFEGSPRGGRDYSEGRKKEQHNSSES